MLKRILQATISTTFCKILLELRFLRENVRVRLIVDPPALVLFLLSRNLFVYNSEVTSVPNCGDFSPNGRFLASSWRPLFCKNRQRNLGDFRIFVKMGEFGRNLLNYLAKWAISDYFWQKCYCKSADFGHFEGWRFLAQNFAPLANFDQPELGTLPSYLEVMQQATP